MVRPSHLRARCFAGCRCCRGPENAVAVWFLASPPLSLGPGNSCAVKSGSRSYRGYSSERSQKPSIGSAGPLTTPQASRHATDRIVAPPYRAFDARLRPGPFPDQAASLLPGLLAATRTGLPPAGDDELTNTKKHHGLTSRCHRLPGARNIRVKGLSAIDRGWITYGRQAILLLSADDSGRTARRLPQADRGLAPPSSGNRLTRTRIG
jgi:hypothetical protein